MVQAQPRDAEARLLTACAQGGRKDEGRRSGVRPAPFVLDWTGCGATDDVEEPADHLDYLGYLNLSLAP